MKRDRQNNEPRYAPVKAAVMALARPVTAVRRADHLGIGWAWAVHVSGLVALMVTALLLAAWEESPQGFTFDAYQDVLMGLVQRGVKHGGSYRAFVGQASGILVIEGVFCLSAFVAMSWCARDEKIRRSYTRALRRLFLLTPHTATVVALMVGSFIWLDRAPWPVSYRDLGQLLVFAMACLWSLRVALKALSCKHAPAMCRWPACCEGCGYQLLGLARDQNCPECGLAMVKTLGQDIRPGILLNDRCGLIGWLRVTCLAVRRPADLGKALRVLSADTGYQKCLTTSLVLVMATVAVAGAGALAMDRGFGGYIPFIWSGRWDVIIGVGTLIGLMMVATTAGAALGGAVLAGLLRGPRQGRNLMPAAIRSACYLSGFAVAWALVYWCSALVFLVVMELDLLSQIAARYNLALENLVLAWHGSVVGLGLFIYLVLIGRATHAARHANW